VGIVGKVHTAKRTSVKSYPNNFGDATERGLRTKRLIRTVAVMFGAPTMTSSTLRGHNSALVALFRNTEVTSDFWYERVGPAKWQLTLGAATTVGGNGLGDHRGDDNGDGRSAISRQYFHALTRDGALVKGKLHDSLRQVIGTPRRPVSNLTSLPLSSPRSFVPVTRPRYSRSLTWCQLSSSTIS